MDEAIRIDAYRDPFEDVERAGMPSVLLDMIAAPFRRFGGNILNGALLIPVEPGSF